MALLLAKSIIGLPVETQHGKKLGRVVDIAIDIENHTVKKYHVAASTLVKHLLKETADLLIDPTQVVSISAEKMVVVDLESGETIDAFEEMAPLKKARSARTTAASVDELTK